VKEGKLIKITSRFVKETLFFLFNDVLVYAYEVLVLLSLPPHYYN
jgi:hypothetical protein